MLIPQEVIKRSQVTVTLSCGCVMEVQPCRGSESERGLLDVSRGHLELAWHFVADTLRDGSPIPPDGEWLEYKGLCVLCSSGLHASRNPFDALGYAICRQQCAVHCVSTRRIGTNGFSCE